jgi:hypothetical protein
LPIPLDFFQNHRVIPLDFLNLDVNSTTIHPEICGIWDDNLLIKIPADDAAKITGNACAAIAMLPIDTLRGKLSQPDK